MLLSPAALAATDQEKALNDLATGQIKAWVAETIVIDAVRAQNKKNADLSQDHIDKLDKQWRAETKASSKPLIDSVLATALSRHLKGVKDKGKGLFTEIFVMDNKGLNVGQSDVTSDYWQGDEGKWKKTFLAGPDTVFVDEVEFDESTQSYQAQVSVSIADPDTKKAIGSITVGVNVELLKK
jgi:hypothetical protein